MKTKLRQLARKVPYCMGCGLENPNGDLLCLAHSNSLADGRGAYHKSLDLYGCVVCHNCHQKIDIGHGLTKEEKRAYHHEAWVKTMRWLIDNEHIKVV